MINTKKRKAKQRRIYSQRALGKKRRKRIFGSDMKHSQAGYCPQMDRKDKDESKREDVSEELNGENPFPCRTEKGTSAQIFFFNYYFYGAPYRETNLLFTRFHSPPPPPPLISFALFSHRCGRVLLDPRYAPRSGLVEMATSALSGCVQVTTNIGDFLSCGRSSLLLLVTSSLSEVPSYSLSQVPSQKFPLTPCHKFPLRSSLLLLVYRSVWLCVPALPSQLSPFVSSISHGQSA